MILQIEHDIKAAIRNALGKTVRAVETHPGNWNKETIAQILTNAPCVYVGWSAGVRYNEDELKSTWHVYLIARALQGRTEVGIYDMAEQLMVSLHGLDLDQPDSLRLKQLKNLFSFGDAKVGLSCYEMTFELLMNWPDHVDASALEAFERFHADTDSDGGDILMSADTELPK